MHNLMGAVGRRKASLTAGVVLAGGLAGGVLLTPGTAFASTATTTAIGTITAQHHFNGSWSLNVPVTVSPAGGSVAPDGTVTVSDGSESCGITLAQIGSTANSGGSCNLGGLSAGTYSITATYGGSTTNGFAGSAGNGSANVGIAPHFKSASPSTSANNGDSYSYNFNATGDPSPAYSLSGAPGWLSINSSTGVVSGHVPNGINSFTYSVLATNNVGSATAGPFTVSVSHGHPGHGNLATSLNCTDKVHSGARGTCTLKVTNTGYDSARGVVGQISLPQQLKADFCGHGWGWGWYNQGCSINGNTATENLGTLRPGQTRSVTVTFTARTAHWLWGYGNQSRDWVKVTGTAKSQGNWSGWNWWPGSSSTSHAWVQIVPPRYWW